MTEADRPNTTATAVEQEFVGDIDSVQITTEEAIAAIVSDLCSDLHEGDAGEIGKAALLVVAQTLTVQEFAALKAAYGVTK